MQVNTVTSMHSHSQISQLTQTSVGSHAGATLGRILIIVFGAFALIGTTTTNPYLTVCGCLIPPILFALLWRKMAPPVLLFASAFQWLQAFATVLSANLEQRTLNQIYGGSELAEAAWLSLFSVLVVATGMHLAIRNLRNHRPQDIEYVARRLSRRKLFHAYLIGQIVATAAITLGFHAGGLRQILVAIALIKWVPLFLLCWSTIQCQKPVGYMVTAIAIEIVMGFSGYFSQFKTVLFLVLIIAPGAGSFRKNLPIPLLATTLSLTLGLVLGWQAIKVDYRTYLNQGTGMQTVSVPLPQRLQYLWKATASVTLEEMHEGLISGINRVGYITYFANSIRNVPASVPHQDGDLWIGAIQHMLMPRLLFPEKPAIDASSRTAIFTGTFVPGKDRGTSISIGYVGESYIDFGIVWMFAPLFLLGLTFGIIYRSFISRVSNPLLGMALATIVIMNYALQIEMSNISMVGGLTMSILVLSTMQSCFGTPWMMSLYSPESFSQSSKSTG
jgi:hypothetical protein